MVAKCAFNSFLAKQKRSQQSELNWKHWAPKTEFLDLALGRQTDRQTYRHTHMHVCIQTCKHAHAHMRQVACLCFDSARTVYVQCTPQCTPQLHVQKITSCVEIASNQFKGYLEACFFCVLIRRGHFVWEFAPFRARALLPCTVRALSKHSGAPSCGWTHTGLCRSQEGQKKK